MNELSSGGTVSLWRFNGSLQPNHQFVVDSSGLVGIGTSVPATILDIRNPNGLDYPYAATQCFMPNSYTALNYSNAMPVSFRLKWYDDTWDIGGIRGNGTSFDALAFRYNGSERVTIRTGGNVGIGTTNPDTLLHVYGKTMIYGNTTGGPANGRLGSAGTMLILWPGDTSNTPFALGCNDGLWYGARSGYGHKFYVGTSEVMRLAETGTLWLKSSSTDSGLSVNCANVNMTIGSCAGTTNSGSIQVKAGGTFTTVATSVGYNLCLNPDGGNVSIGTSAPGCLFHVQNSTGGNMIRSVNTSTETNWIYLDSGNSAGRMFIGMDNVNGLNLFGTGDTYGACIGTPDATSLSFATSNVIQAKLGSNGDFVFGPLTFARRIANVSVHRSGNASFAIVSGSENTSSTLFLGTPCLPNSAGNNAYKTAIIAQPSGSGWSTANLHFCLRSTAGTDGQSSNDPSLANATVNDSKMVVTHTGLVGIGITSPLNVLDVAGAGRSGTHGSGLPFYVTGDVGGASAGFEFRHSNGTQGIGIGFSGIYTCGTSTNHDGISIVSAARNGVKIKGQSDTVTASNPGYPSLQVEGSTAYDGGNYVHLVCNASQFGRNQLILTGRLENDNDAWSFDGFRNGILFRTQSSLGSAYTNRWTIQNWGDQLGFLGRPSGDNPLLVMDGAGRVYFNAYNSRRIMQVLGGDSNGFAGNGAVHIRAVQNNEYSGRAQDCLSLVAWNDSNLVLSCYAGDNTTFRGGIYGVNSTSIRYDTSSDRRLKENIHEMEGALDIVTRLTPVHFRWKPDQQWDFGLIAQEVYDVLPHMRPNFKSYMGEHCTCEPNSRWEGTLCDYCETTKEEPMDPNGKPLTYSLDYGKFTPYLIAAIKEQQKQIDNLKEEIRQLKDS